MDETLASDTPPCKYARARKDEQGTWDIRLCYGHLPLAPLRPISHEYMGDYFMPVVWDTEPSSQKERDDTVYQISAIALDGKFTDPFYRADDDHGVYRVNEQGVETLICVAGEWGDPWEIAYAMNHTFPHADTNAYHKQRSRESQERTAKVIAQIQAGMK